MGCSIREYFEREGEDSFRDVEERVIAELTQTKANGAEAAKQDASKSVVVHASAGLSLEYEKPTLAVLSTGGGAVLRSSNRRNLRASGTVVYLRPQPDELFKRLRNDRNRPLLQVDDPLQRLRDLFAVRDPLYRETAHFVVETGRPSVATLVNMIVMQLELSGSLPSQG